MDNFNSAILGVGLGITIVGGPAMILEEVFGVSGAWWCAFCLLSIVFIIVFCVAIEEEDTPTQSCNINSSKRKPKQQPVFYDYNEFFYGEKDEDES